ncbi:MAG TPA: hypothetical protein VM142_04410 [Acidimicrobiales bacterium]|nr:hypothetical protein [Acidimicrobiales bacterium]
MIYTSLPQLSGFLLEESYVLDIEARPSSVSFALDLVLTPEHPHYADPAPGEQHCFRRGHIEFLGVRRLLWTAQGAPPARDASGEVDYGNIDSFNFSDLGYELEGSWGRMELQVDEVRAVLEP